MKKGLTVVTVIAVLAVVVCLVPLPKKIDQNVNGIFWADSNDALTEECTVTVKGWYYRYLVKDNVFKGEISFSAADETTSYSVPNMSLYRDSLHEGKTGAVTVYDAQTNQMLPLGQMTISGNFEEILIQSEEWNISSPAEDLEGALRLASELTTEGL